MATRSRWMWCGTALVLGLCGAAVWAAPNAAEQAAIKKLSAKGFEARVDALEKLKRSKDPAVVTAVVARLQDADATVRWAAVETLEAMGAVTAVEALEKAAQDPSPLVANRAREALSALQKQTGGKATGTSLNVGVHDARPTPQAPLQQALEAGVKEGLGNAPRAAAAVATHDASFQVVNVTEKTQGNTVLLEVACTATVAQLPSRALRFATRVAAAVDLPAAAPQAARLDALQDAVRAAGVGLGQEVAEWASRSP